MDEFKLSDRDLVKALRCCATTPGEGGGCGGCPMKPHRRKVECYERICLMAADRIEAASGCAGCTATHDSPTECGCERCLEGQYGE